MGQTLTHGVYLPDEGERNCYSGLAGNWTILDNSVGTIAEHTTALAGKAPAVHTHTKSDITDFPAYGTTAGTICEGNDSRLSDARTPVAHTHGKADITDLFNSANTWSGYNIFQQNITYERTNLSHNAVNPCYILKDTELEKGTLATTHHAAYTGNWHDKNSAILGYMRFVEYSSGRQTAEIRVGNLIKNGALDPTGTEVNCTALLELQPSGEKSLIPEINNYVNLGTSTNKWKTLNGINPGALSLPDYSKSMNVDTTGWSTSTGRINYTPTVNGWLQIAIPNDIDNNNEKSNFITIMDTDIPNVGFNNPSGISAGNTNDYRIQVTFPVVANKTYYIYIKSYSGNIYAVKYIPALGHI